MSIRKKILAISIGPVLVLGVITLLFMLTMVKSSLMDEVQDALKGTAAATLAAYDQNTGDYLESTNGDIWKGSYNISKSENLVDRIIDEIAEDERVDALYKEWNKWQGEIRKFYENSPEKQVPLSQCAAFKSLKNLIISEAMQISHNVRSTEWIQGEVAVREPSVFFATVRLMTGLQKIFQEEFRKENRTGRYHIDRKRRKKLTERRRAQGHRTDDHEPEQQIEG